jgi:GST-like protein
MMQLHGHKGWGSTIVEAQLAFHGLPFDWVEAGDLLASADARHRLAPLNPVAQVPTLVLEDGAVMTESAAITLWLADRTGSHALVPAPGTAERPQFLRWLVFLVANIYPCFTFADLPERFVAVEDARKPFRSAVDAHLGRLWLAVEAQAGAPWFLGARFSALDIYVAVMSHWRPGRAWFAAQAPRLHGAACAAEADPRLTAVFRRNFADQSASS